MSNRSYLNKILNCHGLINYFNTTYAWEDVEEKWKDVRRFDLDLLIDDSDYHRQQAKHATLHRYIIVPAYGSSQDNNDPRLWRKIVRQAIKAL